MRENFTEIISLLEELQLLQYFIPYFKIMLKKCPVYNVVKQFFANHVPISLSIPPFIQAFTRP